MGNFYNNILEGFDEINDVIDNIAGVYNVNELDIDIDKYVKIVAAHYTPCDIEDKLTHIKDNVYSCKSLDGNINVLKVFSGGLKEYINIYDTLKKMEIKDFYKPYIEYGKGASSSAFVKFSNGATTYKKNIIRPQRHAYQHVRKIEKYGPNNEFRSINREPRLDKPLPVEYLFFCDKCKKYEPVKVISVLRARKYSKGRLTLFNGYIGVKTQCCDTFIDNDDIKLYEYEDVPGKYQRANRHFFNSYYYENDTKDKITISSIDLKYNCYYDKLERQYLNNKLVFNLKTGRTYVLPEYDLYKKTKSGHLKCVSAITQDMRLYSIKIEHNDLMMLGKAIEDYNKKIDPVGVISFEDYINATIKNFGYDKNLLDYSKQRIRCVDDNVDKDFYSSHLFFSALFAYNCNPYITFKQFMFCYNTAKEIYKKADKIKKTKNKKIFAEIMSYYKDFNKKEREFIVDKSSLTSNDIRSIISYVKAIKGSLNDVNNVYKILNLNGILPHYLCNLSESMFFNDLVKRHGENNVVNAMTKAFESNNMYYFSDASSLYQRIMHRTNGEYKIPCKRLRLKEIHDKMSIDYNKLTKEFILYKYNQDVLDTFNTKLNDITFKVAENNYELTEIGSNMNICVGGYDLSVVSSKSFIVSMIKDGNYIGCLEFDDFGSLVQAKAKRNKMLTEDEQNILASYCSSINSVIHTHDVLESVKRSVDVNDHNILQKYKIKEEPFLTAYFDQRTAAEKLNNEEIKLIPYEEKDISHEKFAPYLIAPNAQDNDNEGILFA